MSYDIDIKSLTGANFGPAAEDQPQVDLNSYTQEAEYPLNDLLNPEYQEEKSSNEFNPQAEHFRALREEVDRMKAERENEKKEHQLQLEMLRANLSSRQQPDVPKQERKFLDGMQDNDVPSVAELRREMEQREALYAARLEELQVAQAHPDYNEVIEKYAIPLVKQKPHLAQGLNGASNKAMFAYELGKMAQQMQQPQSAPVRNENALKMVENSRKPGTLSQAGGQNTLSKADYFASMSDQEFMQYATRNLEGI
jgi:hypothetical protein